MHKSVNRKNPRRLTRKSRLENMSVVVLKKFFKTIWKVTELSRKVVELNTEKLTNMANMLL